MAKKRPTYFKFHVLRIEMSANFACRWPLAGSRAYYWESANPEIISGFGFQASQFSFLEF